MIKEQLKIMIQLAVSDGMIAEKESRLIMTVGLANGLSKEVIKGMMEAPEPMGSLSGLTDDQKFEYLYNIVQMMKVDGQVFKSEISFAEDVAAKLGYKKEAISELSSRIYSDPSITSHREDLKKRVNKFLV
ncbi:MAG TPA: TerB family tellurite resistance protein [Cyclobacteriaceae bacterium]|jgi:uncharacterized tellurite resistance protein B-like protein